MVVLSFIHTWSTIRFLISYAFSLLPNKMKIITGLKAKQQKRFLQNKDGWQLCWVRIENDATYESSERIFSLSSFAKPSRSSGTDSGSRSGLKVSVLLVWKIQEKHESAQCYVWYTKHRWPPVWTDTIFLWASFYPSNGTSIRVAIWFLGQVNRLQTVGDNG